MLNKYFGFLSLHLLVYNTAVNCSASVISDIKTVRNCGFCFRKHHNQVKRGIAGV